MFYRSNHFPSVRHHALKRQYFTLLPPAAQVLIRRVYLEIFNQYSLPYSLTPILFSSCEGIEISIVLMLSLGPLALS